MKSTVTTIFDYQSFPIPEELRRWRIPDAEIQARLETLSHNHSVETEPDTVEALDGVACKGESTVSRWNRPNLQFYPGRKLCSETMENALIGAKLGETRTVSTEEGDITLTVNRIVRRRHMPVGDELVQEEHIPGVSTLEDFARWYRETHEPEQRYNAKMRMAYALLHQITDRSQYAIDEEEKRAHVTERVNLIYEAYLKAGIDPTIPEEGTDFLTEEQAKEKMYRQFASTFPMAVASEYLVRTLDGVEDVDAFCQAGLEKLAADNHLTVEELLQGNGIYVCREQLLQNRALELLADYAEQYLEA